jgi:hypothetical protein
MARPFFTDPKAVLVGFDVPVQTPEKTVELSGLQINAHRCYTDAYHKDT